MIGALSVTLSLLSFLAAADYTLTPIFRGLDKPLSVLSIEIEGRETILVAEQGGHVEALETLTGRHYRFIDISDRSYRPRFPADERGLLGLEYRPGTLYLNYVDREGATVISHFDVDPVKLTADHRTEKIILTQEQPYPNHNGGHLAFGPDGYLYIGLGDGGSAGDPMSNAQDLSSFLGKMLRIDPSNETQGYNIPSSNPFYRSSDARPEIWAYGLRNPWRYAFDSKTGDLYIADVGQSNWEEISVIDADSSAPHNLGWNVFEGKDCYRDESCSLDGHHAPIFVYPNNANYLKTIIGINDDKVNGCSVTGGVVYRGHKITELYGRYVFGDYCTGKVWSIDHGKDGVDFDDLGKKIFRDGKSSMFISSFGTDADGEILIVDYKGTVYRLDIK